MRDDVKQLIVKHPHLDHDCCMHGDICCKCELIALAAQEGNPT